MGQTAGLNQWDENVYLFEQTDLVLAETDNVPLQSLANRTKYLQQRIGLMTRLDGVVTASNAAQTIDATAIGKLISATGNDNIRINLAAANTFPANTVIPVACSVINGKCLTIAAAGTDKINQFGELWQEIYLHGHEHVMLMRSGTTWEIISCSPGLLETGDEFMARYQRANTLTKMGQLVKRADFARLFRWLSKLETGITTEANWQSNARYRGFFTNGTDGTNFRLPDDRGMFERALDLGRGEDVGRLDADVPGSRENDEIKSHAHAFRDRYLAEQSGIGSLAPNKETIPTNYNNKLGSGDTDQDNSYFLYIDKETGNTGGLETRPKNVGKYPLIKI